MFISNIMESFLDKNIHTLNKNNQLNLYITNNNNFISNIKLTEPQISAILKNYNNFNSKDYNYVEYRYDNCSIQANKKENYYTSKKTISACTSSFNGLNILCCIFKYNLFNENLITHSNFSSIEKKQSKIFNLGNFELIIDYFETNKYFTAKYVVKKPVEKKKILTEIEKVSNLIK